MNREPASPMECIGYTLAAGGAILLLLALIAIGTLAVAKAADGPPPLPTPQQVAACAPDALRFCSAFIRNGHAIPGMDSCMAAHRPLLSPACREIFK